MELTTERASKPAAVTVLQVAGGLYGLAGVVLLIVGAILGFDELASAYAVIGSLLLVAGLLGLASGWRRPTGFVAGMMGLAFMLPMLIFGGPLIVAIVVTTGVRGRDRIRDFYAEGAR